MWATRCGRSGRRRSSWTVAGTVLAASVVAAVALGACARGDGGDTVSPSGVGPVEVEGLTEARVGPAATDPGDDATDSSTAPPSPIPPPTPIPSPTEHAAEEPATWRELVDGALLRYATVLTDLAVDPVARTAEGTPQREAWDAAVVPGSWLWVDVPAELVRRQREEGVVVLPAAHGLSYRHRALRIEPPVAGAISFTWCGWSPGIGIDADTGEIVDDAVAHSHGTGQLRDLGGHWALEALDQLDLTLLEPGSPDPCPAEVAAAGEGAGR